MRRKPFKVTLQFMKNIAASHRPPKMVESTREETMWAVTNAEIRRSVRYRYGFNVNIVSIVSIWDN